MSLKVKLSIGGVEVEVQGTPKEVSDTFDHLDKYRDKFLKAFSPKVVASPAGGAVEAPSLEPSEEIPQITNFKTNVDAIKQLLTSGWAYKPRTIGEIGEAIRISGLYLPSTSLSGILTDLVRRGAVSRTRTQRGFGYYVPVAKAGGGIRTMGPSEKPRDSEEE